jgi:DNA-binding HxlR family transcriptional regulator
MTKAVIEVVAESSSSRPIMQLIDLLGTKWIMRILWEMNSGPWTFRELQDRCGGISPTMINSRMKDLIAENLVDKDSPSGYKLTVLGKELVMLFSPLNQWAEEWVEKRDNKKFEKGESQS